MRTRAFLQKLQDDVASMMDQVQAEFYSLPDEKFHWKPSPERWSILECIEHLNRYNRYYLMAVEDAFHLKSSFKDEELNTTWIGQKSIAMMHPSNRKKQKTFKKKDPSNSNPGRAVLDTFLKDQEKLRALFMQAFSRNINLKNVRVEFLKLLKMTTAETLEFVVVHEQRHLRQASEVLQAIPVFGKQVLAV